MLLARLEHILHSTFRVLNSSLGKFSLQSMSFYLGPWLAAGSRTSFRNFSKAWDIWEASAVWAAIETTSPYLPALRTLIYLQFWLEACFGNLLESFARRHFPNSQPLQILLGSACIHSGSAYIHSWDPGIASAASNPEGPPSFGDWMVPPALFPIQMHKSFCAVAP